MFDTSEALDFLDWGSANLLANRICAARARIVLDDASARLRRCADSRASSYQCKPPQGPEHAERGFTSQDVYAGAGRPSVCGRISQMLVPTRTAAIIAQAYEIGDPGQVQLDARELNEWTLPLDDFATRVGTVHGWKAETIVIYIGALRSALIDRHAPTPWDDL